MIKWSLFQECKVGFTFNTSVILHTYRPKKEEEKAYDHLNICQRRNEH